MENEHWGQKITDVGVYQLANEFHIEYACVRAVMEVESRNSGFYDNSVQPVILFEGKHFHNFTNGIFDKKYPTLSFPVNNKSTRKYYDLNQVKRFDQAYSLAPKAALLSTSWGMMQVMAFNYKLCSYPNVEAFVKDCFISEYNQIRIGMLYIKNAGLIPALNRKDFNTFRKGYNGDTPDDPYDYTGKLQRSYEKWNLIDIQSKKTITSANVLTTLTV